MEYSPESLFEQGYNCAQSVFVPAVAQTIKNTDLAFKLMAPFGGGLANTDNLCGAVSGAIAAIGYHLGNAHANDGTSKEKCNKATQDFIHAFKKEFSSIQCTALLNHNLSIAEEKARAKASGLFDTKCPKFMERASVLVAEIIKKNQ